jgi:hypothetical protein
MSTEQVDSEATAVSVIEFPARRRPTACERSDDQSSLFEANDSAPLSDREDPWDGARRSAPGVLDWRQVMDARIDAYAPRGAGPAWLRVAAEVRRAVKLAEPQTASTARQLAGATAQLAMFADGLGHRADAKVWLTHEMIEHFIDAGCPSAKESTRGNYRARLRRVHEAVLGPDLLTGCAASLSGSLASQPYADAELTDLWSWAGGQPTQALRHGTKVLMALGFGCGLDSSEAVQVRAHDVRRTSAGVEVEVRGARKRIVTCRRPWEGVLAQVAAEVEPGDYLFRPGAERGKNLVTNFLARTRRSPTAPTLSMGRARSTWIVDLVDANVRLTALVAAAGVDSLHAFSRLMPYFKVSPAHEAARALRGEG